MKEQTNAERTYESQVGSTAIRRRDVLKSAGATGAAVVGIAGASGTVAAGDTPDQLYFCGCSQVVVTGLLEARSITVYLRATEDGGCRVVTVEEPDCEVGGGREYAFRYEYEGGEAILAVETPDGNVWCNPNNCAQKWLDSLECFAGVNGTLSDNCTDYSELDPPGDVFTNRCGTVCSGGGPPNDNGNGPPNDNSNGPPNGAQ